MIAIIRKQANVTDPSAYLGPILFNPGGPGVSGVDWVLQNADQFAAIVGPQFDLIGFDLRGISDLFRVCTK
jgi:pimeloyl-ACP methyl ester carboxylesterase